MEELFEVFQEFRRVLCLCPCCGSIVRLSDLHLKVKGPVIKTWFDDYEKKLLKLEEKEEQFDEQEEKLREKAREKGRKQAQSVFNECIDSKFKSLKLDPFDIKPILHPVDFVVFKGMNNDNINSIMLLSRYCKNPDLCTLRKHIQNLVLANRYEWQVARITADGKMEFEK